MILFLHSALFLPSFSPAVVIYLSHAYFHLMVGRPILLLFPGMSTSSILLAICSSFILLTCSYHFCRFSVIFLGACATLVVLIMCSFRIASLIVTPHSHLSILTSFTTNYRLVVVLVLLLVPGSLHYTT